MSVAYILVEKFFKGSGPGDSVTNFQCDQMAILFVQFLVIYKNKKLPNSLHNSLKWIQNFAHG